MSIQRPRGSLLKRTQLSSLTKFRSQLQNEQQQQQPQNNRGLSNSILNTNRTNFVENPQNTQSRNRNTWKSNTKKAPLQAVAIANSNPNSNSSMNNLSNNNNRNRNRNNRYNENTSDSNNSSFDNARLSRNNRRYNNNNNKENVNRSRKNRSKSRTRNTAYKKPMTLNETKEKIKSLRKQLSEVNEVNERLNDEMNEVKDELENIYEKNSFDMQQKDQKINNLQSENQKISNENNLNKQQIQQIENQLTFQNQQMNMVTSARDTLQQQLNQLSQTIKMKDQMLNNNKTQMQSIESANHMLTQTNNSQQKEIFELNNKLKHIQNEYNKQSEEMKRLRGDNMTISLKNTSLNNQNEAQMRQMREYECEINKEKQEKEFNYRRMEQCKQENDKLRRHVTMLESETNKQSEIINGQKYEMAQMKEKCVWYEEKARNDEEIRKRLHNQIQELKGNIRVFCRVRPILSHESNHGEDEIYEYNNDDIENQEITLLTPNNISGITGKISEGKQYKFNFDRVFRPFTQQLEVFNDISQLIQSALDGYKVCIFAYGQTGSGKTFTMEGQSLNKNDINRGMIPRSVEQIFKHKEKLKEKGWQYKCVATYLEIYNEKIRDLLVQNSKKNSHSNSNSNSHVHMSQSMNMCMSMNMSTSMNMSKSMHMNMNSNKSNHHNHQNIKYLEIRQRKNSYNNKIDVYVDGLTEKSVDSPFDVYPLLQIASANRSVGKTDCNERSSRSHSVFQLFLNGYNTITKQSTFGVLNLIDLAGSERLKKSNAKGIQLKETQNINKSLSCLGDVIAALSSKKNRSHIPYRNSKLTYLLMNSFGGDAKTLMFVNLCPGKDKIDESLCSLRFAAKVNDCQIGIAKRTVAQ